MTAARRLLSLRSAHHKTNNTHEKLVFSLRDMARHDVTLTKPMEDQHTQIESKAIREP